MNIVYPNGKVTVAVPASAKVAVLSEGPVTISQVVGYPNVPATNDVISSIENGRATTAAFTAAATVIIESGGAEVIYEVGTDAIVKEGRLQGTPGVLNATGALTAAMLLSGLVTSTTAAAVAATIPTGAVMDLATSFDVDEYFDWSVITTGANALTVTAAASGHTVVGNMVVAAGKAGLFRTRKTASDTFVTYSLSNV